VEIFLITIISDVSRDDIRKGAEMLNITLDEHIDNVIRAMQGIASELELR
jgi:predicted hydrolase (HD superfamily)